MFGSIAAIALTIVTGGAGPGPLGVAIIAYSVIDTTLTVADAISGAAHGPRLDMQDLLTEGFTAAGRKCGENKKKAEEVGQWCAFGVQIAVTVATLAYSGADIYRSLKGAKTLMANGVSKVSEYVLKSGRITGITAQLIGAGTQVASGGITVSAGNDQNQVDKANNEKHVADNEVALLSDTIKRILDRLQALAVDLSTNMGDTSNILKSICDTDLSIANGGQPMV